MTINEIIEWHMEQAQECRQTEEIDSRKFHLEIVSSLKLIKSEGKL
jgi:hypothetical protein